ncbi:MAG: SCO family protein [Alphaproteobacteria bacterium]|nr:SCO family protein [Alphaproteobacteria bacterium]
MDKFRRNPVLWLIVLGAILVYSVLEGGLLGDKKGDGTATTLATGVGIGGPFALVDQNGQTVTHENFAGKLMLVYFGFTFCPDICLAELMIMGQAVDLLGPQAEEVVPIFITVDPKRDPPEKMKDYVAAFHPRMVGLSGSEEQVTAAAKAYRVYYKYMPAKKDGELGDDYNVDHTSYIYLMDRSGNYLAHFTKGQDPQAIADGIKKVL